MEQREKSAHPVREAANVVAAGCTLPYAALLVSSVVLGFELFRG